MGIRDPVRTVKRLDRADGLGDGISELIAVDYRISIGSRLLDTAQ